MVSKDEKGRLEDIIRKNKGRRELQTKLRQYLEKRIRDIIKKGETR